MIDFQEAERQFEHLQAERQQGKIDEAQYRVEIAKLLVRDSDGAFWMLDAETGRWVCNRGEGWTEAEPDAEAGAEALGTARGQRALRRLARRGGRGWPLLAAIGALLMLSAAATAIVALRWPRSPVTPPEASTVPTGQVGVTIASPPDGGSVAPGQEVGIEAMLQVGSGLASTVRAELQVDGEVIAAQTVHTAMEPGQGALPLSFPWRPKAAGEHEVSVAVLDDGGELVGQATIHLDVEEGSEQLLPEPRDLVLRRAHEIAGLEGIRVPSVETFLITVMVVDIVPRSPSQRAPDPVLKGRMGLRSSHPVGRLCERLWRSCNA